MVDEEEGRTGPRRRLGRSGTKRRTSHEPTSKQMDMLAGEMTLLRDELAGIGEVMTAILRLNKRMCRLLVHER